MKYTLYNDTLNPVLWDDTDTSYKLKPNVRDTLQTIAEDFVEIFLKEKEIEIDIVDILLVGSSANYNYTQFSDIDLHIVTDFSNLDMTKEMAKSLFTELKLNWNNSHNVKVKGIDVEMYVQDKDDDLESEAIYSVEDDKWISEPKRENPKFDKKKIIKKYTAFKMTIEGLLKKGGKESEDGLRDVLNKLYKFRQSGLNRSGEFSPENIVFKILRAKGYLDRIKEYSRELYDQEVSLNEQHIEDGIQVDKDGGITNVSDKEDSLVKSEDDLRSRMFKSKSFNYKGTPVEIFAAYTIDGKDIKAQQLRSEPDVSQGDGNASRKPKPALSVYLTRLRHAIKHPQNASSKSTVEALVDVSLDRLEKQMDLSKIHLIVPLGSKSKLNKEISDKLKARCPNATVTYDLIQKTAWKDVKLSPAWHREKEYEKTGSFWPNGTVRKPAGLRAGVLDAEKMLATKQKDEPNQPFEIKQSRRGSRRYFSAFYKINGRTVDVMSLINGKEVLIIDDTLEEGATLVESIRTLEEFGPSNVKAYIFLYGRGI